MNFACTKRTSNHYGNSMYVYLNIHTNVRWLIITENRLILTRYYSARILTYFSIDIAIVLPYYYCIAFYFIIIIVTDALNWLAIFWKEIYSLRDREGLLKSQLTIFGINYPDSRELAQLDKVSHSMSFIAQMSLSHLCANLTYLYDFTTFFYSRRM